MKISMEKFSPQKVLLGTLIVFFCSMLILQATLTSGWSVQKRRVNFVGDAICSSKCNAGNSGGRHRGSPRRQHPPYVLCQL